MPHRMREFKDDMDTQFCVFNFLSVSAHLSIFNIPYNSVSCTILAQTGRIKSCSRMKYWHALEHTERHGERLYVAVRLFWDTIVYQNVHLISDHQVEPSEKSCCKCVYEWYSSIAYNDDQNTTVGDTMTKST